MLESLREEAETELFLYEPHLKGVISNEVLKQAGKPACFFAFAAEVC